MRNLKYIRTQEKKIYSAVAKSKHQPRQGYLIQITNRITNSYSRYQRHINSIEKYRSMKGLKNDEIDALRHCYDTETAPLKMIKNKIKLQLSENYKCPYCDLGDATKTFDHFLPAESFPELSILSKNLVPCCYDCNNEKGTTSHINSGNQEFFHPYFGSVPTHKYLHCKIQQKMISKKYEAYFYLNRPNNMPQRDFDMASSHFKNLKLDRLYQAESISLINTFLRDLLELQAIVPTLSALSFFSSKLNSALVRHDINHYESVILDELITNPSNIY